MPASSSSSLVKLPTDTYAIYVHKLFVERLKDYLAGKNAVVATNSSSFPSVHHRDAPSSATGGNEATSESADVASTAEVEQGATVLDTQVLGKGASRARRGFVLLLFPGGQLREPTGTQQQKRLPQYTMIAQLSPMIRQNISWIGLVSHTYHFPPCGCCSNKEKKGKTTSSDNEKGGRTNSSPSHGSEDPGTSYGSSAGFCCETSRDGLSKVGALIWESMPSSTDDDYFNSATRGHRLRVNMHPKSMTPDVCRQLQHAASAAALGVRGKVDVAANNPDTGSCDDGASEPIWFTMSKHKCTHRLTVIMVSAAEGGSSVQNESLPTEASCPSCCHRQYTFYWGWEDRTSHLELMDLNINHEAADEIVVKPCNNQTGDDECIINNNNIGGGRKCTSKTTTPIDATVPLSRAYYKLSEVWNVYLGPQRERLRLQQGTGLDLGASPGGWSQVLVHEMGLLHVVAVDAGTIARRLMAAKTADQETHTPTPSSSSPSPLPPKVTHLVSSMEDAVLQPYGPYSITVCDASVLWSNLLDCISTSIVAKAAWCLPSTWVITIKLPFKTLGSIQRHVQLLHDSIPGYLNEMSNRLYPTSSQVVYSYSVVHLMANSDSERTLIAYFE